MKMTPKLQCSLLGIAAGLMLGGTASVMGQATDWFQGFDAAGNETQWVNWWGVRSTFGWSSLDASNNASSGSLVITNPYAGAAGEQAMNFVGFHGGWQWDNSQVLDLTLYTNVWLDILVDPSSSPSKGGNNYGSLTLGICASDNWDHRTDLGGFTIPLSAATNWYRARIKIDTTKTYLNKAAAYYLYRWSDGDMTNTVTYIIDNVYFEAAKIPPPLPTVSLEKPEVGLNFIAASGGQYDRQTIRTVGNRYSWIGVSGDVDYSFNIAKLDKPNDGIDFRMLFAPGTPTATRPDSDWHETNCLMFALTVGGDGSGWGRLRYKTNAYEGNGHIWDDSMQSVTNGQWNATVSGKWTVRFNSDTNVYIIAPSGASATNVIPQDVIDQFKQYNNDMQLSIGIANNNTAKIGHKAIAYGADITGLTAQAAVHSDFLANPVDSTVWFTVADSMQWGVQRITSDAGYWLNWTLPAVDFSAENKANLATGTWTTVTNAGWDGGGKHHVLLSKSDLPSANSGYFHLIKRAATKLLIVLPGETLAPGSPTGKSGTPTAIKAYTDYTFTVYAVDDQFYQVPTVVDTVGNFASTDAGFVPPNNAALVSGSMTFTMQFVTAGTQTLTVSDVTDPTKASSTSSAITVTPWN